MSVGNTRIAAQAGAVLDINAYLAGDLAELKAPIIVNNVGWSYGTGANAVNVIYQDKVTLADGANTTLDLYASGSLLDVFNRALTIEALKYLYIKNNSEDASLLVFGGDSVDIGILGGATEQLTIPPGGHFLWIDPSAAGLDITTNKNLYIEHDGTGSSSMVVDVVAMGLD
jgi:hypothetical protein